MDSNHPTLICGRGLDVYVRWSEKLTLAAFYKRIGFERRQVPHVYGKVRDASLAEGGGGALTCSQASAPSISTTATSAKWLTLVPRQHRICGITASADSKKPKTRQNG